MEALLAADGGCAVLGKCGARSHGLLVPAARPPGSVAAVPCVGALLQKRRGVFLRGGDVTALPPIFCA